MAEDLYRDEGGQTVQVNSPEELSLTCLEYQEAGYLDERDQGLLSVDSDYNPDDYETQYDELIVAAEEAGVYDSVLYHQCNYKREYDKIAYEVMKEPGATLRHVAAALHTSIENLKKHWFVKYPSLLKACEVGLEQGQAAYLTKVQTAAFMPSKDVNNTLIIGLAKVAYGIDLATGTQNKVNLTINNNAGQQAENMEVEDETGKLYQDALLEMKNNNGTYVVE